MVQQSCLIHEPAHESSAQSFTSIPILDYSHTASPASKDLFLAQLRDALLNVGFFYLKNVPVSRNTQDRFVEKAFELFELPMEKKLDIEMVRSKHFLGYSKLGAEITAQKEDFREQFDVSLTSTTSCKPLSVQLKNYVLCVEFATELPAPASDQPVYRNLYGPNQWPDERSIPGFREAVEAYLDEVGHLADSFKSLVAEALGLGPTALYQFFDEPHQNKLKLIKYPSPPPSASGLGVQGVGPHKDSGFLTYLLQATQHTGLEVQNKTGAWIPAPPIPGTLVVNIGRALEALTNGVCVATTHRVSLQKENFVGSNGQKLGPRFSFPVFQGIGLDVSADRSLLQIPPSVLCCANGIRARSDAEATFNEVFKGGFGQGTFIARVTSHQDVAQRWYPDLLAEALRGQKDFNG